MEFLIELFKQALDIVLHMDLHLNTWSRELGPATYAILFFIIFAETGLVFMPFLPGDSFLFALGALAASPNAYLTMTILLPSLTVAAVAGDTVNYHFGKYVGPKVFQKESGLLLNKNHLIKAQRFYEKYGGKTIILARFAPIVRTFAPFVAGIGTMCYRRFISYNIIGGVVWVSLFLLAGFYFGNLPTVQDNFHAVIFAIIALSVMPMLIEYWRARREAKTSAT